MTGFSSCIHFDNRVSNTTSSVVESHKHDQLNTHSRIPLNVPVNKTHASQTTQSYDNYINSTDDPYETNLCVDIVSILKFGLIGALSGTPNNGENTFVSINNAITESPPCVEFTNSIKNITESFVMIKPISNAIEIYDSWKNIRKTDIENRHLFDLLKQSRKRIQDLKQISFLKNMDETITINKFREKVLNYEIDIDVLKTDLGDYIRLYDRVMDKNDKLGKDLSENYETIEYLNLSMQRLQKTMGRRMGFMTAPVDVSITIPELQYNTETTEYIRLYGMPEDGLMAMDMSILEEIRKRLSMDTDSSSADNSMDSNVSPTSLTTNPIF